MDKEAYKRLLAEQAKERAELEKKINDECAAKAAILARQKADAPGLRRRRPAQAQGAWARPGQSRARSGQRVNTRAQRRAGAAAPSPRFGPPPLAR